MMVDFLAGLVGGCCGIIVTHPLDTIKVIEQNYGQTKRSAVINIYQSEGLKGFYKGFTSPLLIIGPSNAVFFGVYGTIVKLLGNEYHYRSEDMREIQHVFFAGCIAGFAQVLITTPVELLKILQQTQQKYIGSKSNEKHNGTYQTFKNVMKRSGVKGLYKGFIPTFIRDCPTSGIYTLTYEGLRFSIFKDWNAPNITKELIAGGFAGIFSTNIVMPVDVIKSRLQADDPQSPKYKGIIDCIQKMYAEEGYPAFLRGFTMTALRVFIMHGIVFTFYETITEHAQ